MDITKSLKAGITLILMLIVVYFLVPNISIMANNSGATGVLALIIKIVLWLVLITMILILPFLVYSLEIKIGNGILATFWLIIMALLSPFIITIIDVFLGMISTDKTWMLIAIISEWLILLIVLFLPVYLILIKNNSFI